jgi:hypothetical protein
MKCGPFAPGGLCCPTDQHYYDPLRLPLSRPNHFPGSPVIGGHRFPPPTVAGPRRLSRVPSTTIRTFNAQYAGGFFSARFWTQSAFRGLRRERTGSAPSIPRRGGSLDDAYSGFTRVADRTVAHALLRTRPLDHARGHRYQGPRRLPGPDSHRQADLNLSLVMSCRSPSLHGSRAVSAHPSNATMRTPASRVLAIPGKASALARRWLAPPSGREQKYRPDCRSGDIAEVESNRPKSPEAFDFSQTEAVIVWSGSGVCLGVSPSNLPACGPWLLRVAGRNRCDMKSRAVSRAGSVRRRGVYRALFPPRPGAIGCLVCSRLAPAL